MKQIMQLMVAAILGSAITIGAYHFSDFNHKTVTIQDNTGTPTATLSNYMPNVLTQTNSAAPGNFTEAAAKTMPAVVHIKSTQNVQQVRNNDPFGGGNDPFHQFREFFGDDFFGGDLFGGGNQRSRDPQPRVGTGSGVIISEDGYIVTNNHVIEGADEIEVTLYDKRSYIAKLIGTDPSTDIALLKVEDRALPTLELANSDDARVGEWVLAVGNPFNLSSTVTAGIVSAKGRNINILKGKAPIESFIQTDAAVNPGNSGGALVNADGDLLGINTAIATPTGTYAGYSFAVPANIVSKVVGDIKEYGIVQRGFLGISIRDLDGNLAKELELDISQGVYIDAVMPESSAEESGLEKGDVIIKVDNAGVNSAPELQEQIARHRPGDKVAVTVNRNGKDKVLYVTLKNKSGNTDVVTKGANAAILDLLGVDLATVGAAEAEELNIKGGVKITDLRPGKLTQATDIRKGFVILKLNDTYVSTVEEVIQLLSNKEGGVMMEGVYPDRPGLYYYAFGL